MENSQKYLYVLFSATPYRMGHMIRFVTGEAYNHVAIAMEEDLKQIYAFARRYYHTPFYGGFVTERPCRYHHNGTTARICLYRLPISKEQWQALSLRLAEMHVNAEHYLYNHLSAAAAPFHRKVRVKDAYTCAEFTVSVLQELGYDFSPKRFYSIGDIAKKLENYRFYDGEFPVQPEGGSSFFAPNPVRHPIYASARAFFALFWRKATT